MFKTSLITTAILFGLAMAKAQPPARTAPTFTEVKAYLTLTDAQVTALTNIQTAERDAARSIQQQIFTKHGALETALQSGAPAATTGALLTEIEALRKQVTNLNTTYYNQAFSVLNDAQKTRLKTLDDARKLMVQVHQAERLNLLTPTEQARPAGMRGFGGPGGQGGPGMQGPPAGRRGFHKGPPPAPPIN